MIEEVKNFIKDKKRPLIVILGPTASGKTALSVKIAHAINGEIISTDSRQIYTEMEISTDAVSPEEQDTVPHHMLGVVKPNEMLTLAEYKVMASQKIREIYARKAVPILCGGTGLYISSIIEDYNVPRVAPNEELRKELFEKAAKEGKESVHKTLEELCPSSAESIHPNNLRYVVRAIEVCKSGKLPSKSCEQSYDTYLIGINWPREILYQRVNKRVDLQVSRGLLEEVKALLDKKYDEDLPAMSSLGVKEIIPYLKGEMELDECLEILKRNTRRYAKRQMTWFRRYDNVKWITPEELTEIVNG